MIRCVPARCRRGALTIEAAIVYPVLIVLLLCLIVGGMGVFRYQQVACQAREAARWASVRGRDWATETQQACPTQQQILQNAVLPLAAGMDTDKLTIQVQWLDQATGKIYDWDTAPKYPQSLNSNSDPVTNKVRVTITYHMLSGLFNAGALDLTSTAEIPMSF